MKHHNPIGQFATVALTCLGLLFVLPAKAGAQCGHSLILQDHEFVEVSASDNNDSAVFDRCWYAGISGGVSNIGPTEPSNGWRVGDNEDAAGKVYIGYQFAPHWFAELGYADLGAAKLDDDNAATPGSPRMDYSTSSLAVGYWFRDSRSSLNYYAKMGISFVQAQINNPFVDVEERHETSTNFGVGMQWRFDSSWFTRMEVDYFDDDASVYYGLGIGRYFGKDRENYEKPADAGPRPEQVIRKLAALNVAADKREAEAGNCTAFTADFSEVEFRVASRYLTARAKASLSKVAKKLSVRPEVFLEIQAYTDVLNSEWDNLVLADAQAKAVRDYLVTLGVPAIQLIYKGYGEQSENLQTPTAESVTYKIMQDDC